MMKALRIARDIAVLFYASIVYRLARLLGYVVRRLFSMTSAGLFLYLTIYTERVMNYAEDIGERFTCK